MLQASLADRLIGNRNRDYQGRFGCLRSLHLESRNRLTMRRRYFPDCGN